ncbi:MAG: amidohydrolase family protein [Actinomycetota bacterium]
MTTIDIHCHVLTPECEELVAPFFSPEVDPFFRYSGAASDAVNRSQVERLRPKFVDPQERLRDMDRMGVDVQAIAIAPPQYFYWTEPELGERLSRLHNDNLAGIVQRHPDRFRALGTLPLQDVDRAIIELDRLAGDLGFTGVEICTNVNGIDFDDARFVPFFQRVQELDLLLVVHPHGFTQGERFTEHYMINTVGMPLDSTVFLAHMIFGGVLERFGELKICVVHGGGYLPFYPARFDHAYEVRPETREHISRTPSTYLRQLHFDTMVYDPVQLGRLIEDFGADHVLMGTDYPFDMGEEDPVGLVGQVDGLTDEQRVLVTGGNAARLLRLER